MKAYNFVTLLMWSAPALVWGFAPSVPGRQKTERFLSDSIPSDEEAPVIPEATSAGLEQIKDDLVRCCTRATKPLLDEVQNLVQDLEEMAEQVSLWPWRGEHVNMFCIISLIENDGSYFAHRWELAKLPLSLVY